VDDFNTEEEQIAALKKWWKEYSSSILMGIGVSLAVIFGWQAYQQNQIDGKSEASLKYQQLITAVTAKDAETDGAETISFLASELKEKFNDTEYAIYASLFIAKESVQNKDLDAAKTELNWVLANSEDTRIKHIVTGRIARILASQDKNEEALAMLVATDKPFEGDYLEIIGDIKNRSGDKTGAIESYTKAFSLIKDSPQSQPLLAVKLADLGVNPETL